MSYLFFYRDDKPQEQRWERRKQQKLDTEKTAVSSTHHSLVFSGGKADSDQCHSRLEETQSCVDKLQLVLIKLTCQNKKNVSFSFCSPWFYMYVDIRVIVVPWPLTLTNPHINKNKHTLGFKSSPNSLSRKEKRILHCHYYISCQGRSTVYCWPCLVDRTFLNFGPTSISSEVISILI